MISGAACTLGYTGDILGPYFLENFKEVVRKDAIKSGGFQVVVGGDAYGSGSSREVAVVAHQGAGIELVIAKSFQRIFQENMVYSGLPFTTDLKYVDRLKAGEDLDIARSPPTCPCSSASSSPAAACCATAPACSPARSSRPTRPTPPRAR
jgi:3-isopropylmalate/(R)-2-methylmalate dehydratase large subunit